MNHIILDKRAVGFLNAPLESSSIGGFNPSPLNHIAATYNAAFRQLGISVDFHCPEPELGKLRKVSSIMPLMLLHNTCIVCQGYGVHAAAIVSLLGRKTNLILHTWKVPFHGPRRISSNINDLLLEKVMRASLLVVVVSKVQQRLIRERYPSVQTVWVPVSADINWWHPLAESSGILARLNLSRGEFLLSVGDVDRDEAVVAGLARELNKPLVRVTRDPHTAARARIAAQKHGLRVFHCLECIPFVELRDLHCAAWAMLNAPTVSYHPAGLTTLTEAMACGGVVLFPEGPTSEGYITPGQDAIIYKQMTVDSLLEACQPIMDESLRSRISAAARQRCVDFLNFDAAASPISVAFND